jgi:proton glutamate symport protein
MTETTGRRFRFTLTHQILLGLAVGILIGWLDPGLGVSLKPIALLFLRLIKMILAPLLITTLVVGIAGAGTKIVGRLGLKAIIWFEAATTAALFIGLGAANLVQPGVGVTPVPPPKEQLGAPKAVWDFILDAFPNSFVDAMGRNDVLQIVVFSVFLGLAVGAAGNRAKPIKDLLEAGAEVSFKLVGYVMRFAPFGVGAAIAATVGKSGPGMLIAALQCVGALYGALIVFFALLFIVLKAVTRVNLRTFVTAIREPAVIAFTTASSEAALPRAMQVLEQLGIPRRIVSFVVPTGYAFNLDGSTLYLALAVMFCAQIAHVDLSFSEQIAVMLYLMLSSKGVAGVPRAALVVLSGALEARHMPTDGLGLLFGIDAVMDMGRTCVNVVGNCTAAVVVAAWEKAIPRDAPIYHARRAGDALPGARVVRDADHAGEPAAPADPPAPRSDD